MDRVHPLIKVGGPILGLLILVYVINAGVDAFRADQKAARDAEREAMLAAAEADQDQEAAVETDSASATGESDSADSEAAPAEVEEPVVYFRQPTTNAIVPPTFKVKMGAEGLVIDNIIECPKHNGRFDYTTGKGMGAPICENLGTYPVRLEGGDVYIDVG